MKLSAIWSCGMVIQRNQEITITGYSNQREVTLTFLGITYDTIANESYEFQFCLPPQMEGGPYTMTLNDGTDYTINEIYIGDVWILGGQSNMQLPIQRILDEEPIGSFQVTEPRIRQFIVEQCFNFHQPQTTLTQGSWASVTPAQVLNFSAVGYYFAKELYQNLHIPIGVILTAIGGTPVEAWMSEGTLHSFCRYDKELDILKSDSYVKEVMNEENKNIGSWYHQLAQSDQGLKESWYLESFNDSSWKSILVPGLWHGTELEALRGSVWFRTTFNISHLPAKEDCLLKLGTLIDADDVYINGVLVGHTDYQYPPRRYHFPGKILHVGSNSITIRIISTANVGGFIPDMPYYLDLDYDQVDLCGRWRYQIGAILPPIPKQTFFQYKPTGLYHGMLSPLKGVKITGFAFYQGESNTGCPETYQELLQAMILDWRNLFSQGELPFVYVQLPNFGEYQHDNGQTNWAVLREQQRKSKDYPNVAMVSAIDLGSYNDLHPQKKKELGIRLSYAARRLAYKEDIFYCGPTIRSAHLIRSLDLDYIELQFDHTGMGILPTDEPIHHFEVLFHDGSAMNLPAYPANHTIQINLPDHRKPIKVRYAFLNNPEYINFYNSYYLPAEAFEIDV